MAGDGSCLSSGIQGFTLVLVIEHAFLAAVLQPGASIWNKQDAVLF